MLAPTLRVMAEGNNAIGDTLTRLVTDVFRAIGYESLRVDIHKTGRELDIKGRHAFEDRILIAECKAQKTPVGGSDINKFVGVIDAERRRAGQSQVYGYYVSLSGYRESAREQEEEIGNSRVILLDGTDVVNRINNSNIIVSTEEAAQAAGRFVAATASDLSFNRMELVAHPIGWVWAVYFRDQSEEEYACFVHADGQVVSEQLLSQFSLDGVKLLGAVDKPKAAGEITASQVYRAYLSSEYGIITLEGMPVDQEIGSKPFKLEDLYVPLEVEPTATQEAKIIDEPQLGDVTAPDDVPSGRRRSIGHLLQTEAHISILGSPGSGKSTLIKRLAVAYSDHGRLKASGDGLPEATWFPLAVRCRHMGLSAERPMSEIIRDSFLRTEHPELVEDFMRLIGDQLRVGNVLLLIDGLDEIPTTSARSSFVSQLRTFLARYPAIRLVLTSREVGFRQVAGAVYSICSVYKVAELSADSIAALVGAWHHEVVGSGPEVQVKASQLTSIIVRTDRVRRLAVNPLLLTILLLVQRWVGQLPRKRTVLYQKAIEVLLMTWNVEGHEPIDLDEALPQLGYAAYRMMVAKESSVSAAELSQLFQDARRDLPELLAYSNITVNTFLTRVEERSSLLILSGYRVIDGALLPVYEFKHLTFQEYLAAQALVNRWLPARDQGKSLLDLLEPILENADWSEVVRMAAVLAGRVDGTRVVEHLIALSDEYQPDASEPRTGVACSNLIGCLGDDVPIAPGLARQAIHSALLGEVGDSDYSELCEAVSGGRYFPVLRDLVLEGLARGEFVAVYGYALARIVDIDSDTASDAAPRLSVIKAGIRSQNFENRITAAALLMHSAYAAAMPYYVSDTLVTGFPNRARASLRGPLDYVVRERGKSQNQTPIALRWMQTWALAWGGPAVSRRPASVTEARTAIFADWISVDFSDFQRKCCWAFGALPIVGECYFSESKRSVKSFLLNEWKNREMGSTVSRGIIIAGLLFGFVWSHETLAKMAMDLLETSGSKEENSPWRLEAIEFTRSYLKMLDDVGLPLLELPALQMRKEARRQLRLIAPYCFPAIRAQARFSAPDSPFTPHNLATIPAHRPYSTAPACAAAVRGVSVSVPPAACADALAACRLRVPDLTPS